MDTLDTKLLLKVHDAGDPFNWRWIHLCYVDTETYEQFSKTVADSSSSLNEYLSLWCKKDFQTDLDMATTEDLKTLKELLKEYYKNEYPELYRDSKTDRQGWTRIWVTDKMKEMVSAYGKESE